jgi:hypothetical protein
VEEPELLVADAEAWRLWLDEHHAQAGASASNVAHVERLTAAGRMRPAGLAAV